MMGNPGSCETPWHVMIARSYKIGDDEEYRLIQESGGDIHSPYRLRWYEKNALNDYLTNKYRKMMVVR